MRIDRRVAVPVLAALAVTALGVSVSLLGGDPGREPRPLSLASGTREADALGAPTASGTESGYTLVGTLPGGTPDDARAWMLPGGPASAAQVQALARALGAGLPQREGSTWRAESLYVSDEPGRSWWWSACATDTPISSDMPTDLRGSSCGVAYPEGTVSSGSGSSGSSGSPPMSSPGSTPLPAPDETVAPRSPVPGYPVPATPVPVPTTPVPKATVLAAARPVIDALGLSDSDAVVETTPYGGSVTVPATIGGVLAHGFATRIDVAPDGELTNAGGLLATPERGDAYPLITAQQAFAALPPRVIAALCPIGPDGKGCLPPEPVEVTGATLGLSLQPLRSGGQVLVPSWLFALKGSAELVPVVAVQPKYLDTGDEPVPTDPGTDPGAKPSTDPGTEPDPGSSPGQVDPAAPQETFSFHQAFRGAQTDSVVVQYGDSGSCPRENVRSFAKESADQVVVYLEADAFPPGIACTDDYRPVEVVVPLQAPLGDRTVIDGASGKPVPVTAR